MNLILNIMKILGFIRTVFKILKIGYKFLQELKPLADEIKEDIVIIKSISENVKKDIAELKNSNESSGN